MSFELWKNCKMAWHCRVVKKKWLELIPSLVVNFSFQLSQHRDVAIGGDGGVWFEEVNDNWTIEIEEKQEHHLLVPWFLASLHGCVGASRRPDLGLLLRFGIEMRDPSRLFFLPQTVPPNNRQLTCQWHPVRE
jgi:hypothetical protein